MDERELEEDMGLEEEYGDNVYRLWGMALVKKKMMGNGRKWRDYLPRVGRGGIGETENVAGRVRSTLTDMVLEGSGGI